MENNYLSNQIKPDLKKLLNEKEHLLNQISTFIDMKHNYEIKLEKVQIKINEIHYIIRKVKDPS